MDLTELKKKLEESLKMTKEDIAKQKKDVAVLEANFNNELSQLELMIRQYSSQTKESVDYLMANNQKE